MERVPINIMCMKEWIWSHWGNSSWSRNCRYDKNYKNIWSRKHFWSVFFSVVGYFWWIPGTITDEIHKEQQLRLLKLLKPVEAALSYVPQVEC